MNVRHLFKPLVIQNTNVKSRNNFPAIPEKFLDKDSRTVRERNYITRFHKVIYPSAKSRYCRLDGGGGGEEAAQTMDIWQWQSRHEDLIKAAVIICNCWAQPARSIWHSSAAGSLISLGNDSTSDAGTMFRSRAVNGCPFNKLLNSLRGKYIKDCDPGLNSTSVLLLPLGRILLRYAIITEVDPGT
ncbi:hypothetical protein J6590_048601 [Homalodisca vitripennis]|nr:hypothetical protein J6590_048601 [Homalodisca vitripennis]